jgi:hypothetical protein
MDIRPKNHRTIPGSSCGFQSMTLNLHQNTDGNSIRDLSHGAIGPYFFVQQAEGAGLGKNRTMVDQWTAIIQGSDLVALPSNYGGREDP